VFPKLNLQSDNLGAGIYSPFSEVTGNMKLRGVVNILEGHVATEMALSRLKKRVYRSLMKQNPVPGL